MDELLGAHVRLRPVVEADRARLVAIRSTPEVRARWRGDDLDEDFTDDLADADLHLLAIETADGRVVGLIQWAAEDDPDYRHASIDLYLDPAVHRQGLGPEAIALVVRHLFDVEGHHRITIDPAADNAAAIRTYTKVGFRPVGVLRRYERGTDGTWHDGLLMELLADDPQPV